MGNEYEVTISWLKKPRSRMRTTISYKLSMLDYEDVSYLGARSPFTQIAGDTKKIREELHRLVSGRYLSVDIHTASDRAKQQEAPKRRAEQFVSQNKSEIGKMELNEDDSE